MHNVSIEALCATAGENPAQVGPLDAMIAATRKVGLPMSKGTVYKAQMANEGPERFIFCGRSIYRLGNFLDWALKRVRKPEDGPAVRAARNRIRNHENISARVAA